MCLRADSFYLVSIHDLHTDLLQTFLDLLTVLRYILSSNSVPSLAAVPTLLDRAYFRTPTQTQMRIQIQVQASVITSLALIPESNNSRTEIRRTKGQPPSLLRQLLPF